MPIARFQLPDGRVARFEVPDGTTPDQAQALMSQAMQSPQAGAPPAAGQAPAATGSDAYRLGRQRPSAVVNAAQGPLFGFGDEIGGAITATLKGIPGLDKGAEGTTWRQRYEGYRDYLRGQDDQRREDAPITSAIVQGAAALPSMAVSAGPAAVVKGTGLLANTARAAISGATGGALSGAGQSTDGSASGVAEDALTSAATSGLLGAVAQPVMAGITGAGRNIAQRFRPGLAEAGAQEKVAESLVRDAQARGAVFRAGADPSQQIAQRFQRLGPEAVLADSGGGNTRQLLDTLATLPGETKEAAANVIRARQAGRAGRLITAADQSLGVGGQRLAGTLDDLIAQREAASNPLYAQLYATTAAPSAALQDIVRAADSLGAGEVGKKIATARQLPYTLGETAFQTGAPVALRDVDHLKQGLDTLIAKQWDNQAGKLTPLGASLQQLKTRLIGEADQLTANPNTGTSLYASARQAYAGPSALMDAANAGRRSISSGEAGIRQTTAGLSPSELDAFRVGAFEALRDKIGRSDAGRTELLNMWKNPGTRERLQAMFGDERSFREFSATAAREDRLKLLEGVGKGSQTAARQYGAGDLDTAALGDMGKAVGAATAGNVPGLLGAASSAWNKVQMPEPVRDAMGRILLSRGAAGADNLDAMFALISRLGERRADMAAGTGALSSYIGTGLLH